MPEPAAAGGDPFGTAAIRRRVVAGWTGSVARFREDANAEEDLVLGGYRDRLVVELAQNAADAARLAGVPGRLRLVLRSEPSAGGAAVPTLRAANCGAPLDADGVLAASTLRASAKRDGDSVGRFGVGFAAVLAATDAPEIVSVTGAVRWSAEDTRRIAGRLPGVGEEIGRRAGHVPVLRLPFVATGAPPDGFATEVVLPLRDAAAEAVVRRLLEQVDPALLMTVDGLDRLEVDLGGVPRVLTATADGRDLVVRDGAAATRWRVLSRSGALAGHLLADRPVEERQRAVWAVRWAVPLDVTGAPAPLPDSVPAVVRAPTPSDEPLSVPAVLAATLPLDPSRRHVAPGPLRDAVLAAAGAAYGELVGELADGPEPSPAVLDLVPTGLGRGGVDAELTRRLLDRLAETAFLPAAEDRALRLRPRDAVAVDLPPAAVTVLAEVLAGLLPPSWADRQAALAVLGVRRLGAAEVMEALAGLRRPPQWWRALYAGLAEGHLGGPERDALAALPVPTADGRLAPGPRGLLLAGAGLDADVSALGLPVVHPQAAHPLLVTLGATDASARSLLSHPVVRAAVAASYDAEDPEPVAEAVLGLVAAAGIAAGEEAWLAELALTAADGASYPAGELLLPGSALQAVVAPDAPFGVVAGELLERWGARVLTAAGVLDRFSVLRAEDVVVDPRASELDLDGEAGWLAGVAAELPPGLEAPAVLAETVAVRDLELVRHDRWPQALELLAEPATFAAIAEPALAMLPDGRRVSVPSYTRWWLRTHPVLAGRRPADLRRPDGDPLLAGLYDDAPAGLPPALADLLLVDDLADLLRSPARVREVLERLGDPWREWPLERTAAIRDLHGRLAAEVDPAALDPPDRVRAVTGSRLLAVPAAAAVIVDAPDLLAAVAARPVVPVPLPLATALADLLDVVQASELADYDVVSAGRPVAAPAAVLDLLGAGCPGRYVEHSGLTVTGPGGTGVPLPWRVLDGVVHVDAAAGPPALARALAWASGRWAERSAIELVLGDPAALVRLRAERVWDG